MTILSDIRNELGKLSVTRNAVWAFIAILFALTAIIEWLWYDFRGQSAVALFICGTLLLFLAVVRWRTLVPLYRIWMFTAFFLGWFVMRILLTATFVVLFIPLNVIMRLTGKDLLMKKKDAGRKSYWIPVEAPKDTSRYLKKF